MLHAAAREGLFCPAYCLMPDHLHLVWMGLWLETNQLNGMAFLRTYLEPALTPAKFQPQAHDPCPARRAATQERLCPGVSLRPEQSAPRRFGDETGGLEVQRRSRPRLSAPSPARRRLLATVLGALRQGPPPRCRKHRPAAVPLWPRPHGPRRGAPLVGDDVRSL